MNRIHAQPLAAVGALLMHTICCRPNARVAWTSGEAEDGGDSPERHRDPRCRPARSVAAISVLAGCRIAKE